MHTGEKPFQCKSCQKSFAQRSDLKKPYRVHTGEKPFQCQSCKKSFSRSDSLITHSRVHTGEKPFQCKSCQKSFLQSNKLKQHYKVHDDEELHKYNSCQKSFSGSSLNQNNTQETHIGLDRRKSVHHKSISKVKKSLQNHGKEKKKSNINIPQSTQVKKRSKSSSLVEKFPSVTNLQYRETKKGGLFRDPITGCNIQRDDSYHCYNCYVTARLDVLTWSKERLMAL